MKIKHVFLLVIGMLFFTSTFAQNWYNGGVTGSGQVVEQERSVSGFTKIEVSHGLDLYITQGPDKVVVKADDNLQEMILTEKNGNTLKLSVKKGGIRNAKAMEIHVSIQQLEALSASGGSDVYSEEKLQLQKLSIDASGGSDIKLDLNARELYLDLSGGSDTYLKGEVATMVVDASGGSDLKAQDLTVEKCQLHTSGASDCRVNVTGEIEMEASGASDIHYSGSPKVVSQRSSGSSDIRGN